MLITNKYSSRGSEWRKWDLHVHTPYSHNYEGDWESFKKQLENTDCDVIGINDYFSVAGYKKLKEEIEAKDFSLPDKVIFPVVEMRMTDTLQNRQSNSNGSAHFNFHIIFSNNLEIEDIESFIKSLDYDETTIGGNYAHKEKLKDVKVSFDVTLKRINSDKKFKDKFLIWLPYNEYGGIGDIDPISDGWIKDGFTRKSHILGSSNKNQIDFFLWKSELKNNGRPRFTQKQFQEWLRNKKPCIKGSDSHNSTYPIGKLRDGNSNPMEKFCWIKADRTFEGLKQIVYEPEDRVKIQESKPEDKQDYQIIDKVEFIDDKFLSNEILIHQNLTTIIGGKSTGKSILLRNIAQSIDSKQVSDKLEEVDIQDYLNQVSDFKVTWRYEQENQANKNNGSNRKIIYIPQSYLNRYIDKKGSQSSMNSIIWNILRQENEVKNALEDMQSKHRKIEQDINESIESLFYTKNDIRLLENSIKDIGDKGGIMAEIEKLKSEINDLNKRGGMANEKILEYNKINEDITKIQTELDVAQKQFETLKKIKYVSSFISFNEDIIRVFNSFPDENRNLLINTFNRIKEYSNLEWDKQIEIINKNYASSINKIETRLQQEHNKRDPLLRIVQERHSINEKNQKLMNEGDMLRKIIGQEEELTKLQQTYNSLLKKIMDTYLNFYKNFISAQNKILKEEKTPPNLEFDLEVVFNKDRFQKSFVEFLCDLRSIGQYREGLLNDYKFISEDKFNNDIKDIMEDILHNFLPLKKSYPKKEVIKKLFQNWFDLKYKIKQDGDEISEMSPGKKSLVMLKFLIELDNSKCPILLDQPEDDLDNRSIYNDLVKFIRDKKKERQIIIVTHNPNLTVGADSECVIVANQNGKDSKNKNCRFEYVQGALENSFMVDCIYTLYKQGIKEHVCDILEGGKEAFDKRIKKYNLNNK